MNELLEKLKRELQTHRIKDVKLDSRLDIFYLLDHETPVTDGELVAEEPKGVYLVYNASYVIIQVDESDGLIFDIYVADPNNLGPLRSKLMELLRSGAVTS